MMRTIIAYCALVGVLALIITFMRSEVRFLPAEKRILEWLRSDPRWHYGLDIVGAGVVDRSSVYIYLGRLLGKGLVQRMDGAKTNPGPSAVALPGDTRG
jgi:hypothetical protein